MPRYEVPGSLSQLLERHPPEVSLREMPQNNYNAHQDDHSYVALSEVDFVARKPNSRDRCLSSKVFWVPFFLTILILMILCYSFGLIPTWWSPTTEQCSPGYSYLETTGYCYKATPIPMTFEKASKQCASEGGDVASIHSETENDFVISLYRNSLGDYRKTIDVHLKRSDLWLGLVYDNEVLKWKWSDGTDLDYQKWAPGEPNMMDQEQNWAQVVLDEVTNYSPDGNKWNNIGEHNYFAFVCKKPDVYTPKRTTTKRPVTVTTTVTTPTTPPQICTPGYQLFNVTGYCYKVMNPTSKLTFSEAEEACQNEQAHLASIHSKEENTFLADLSRQSPETSPAAQYVSILDKHEEVYIGLHYKNGNWWWTDGTPVDYTNWQPKEPNHITVELAATLVTTKVAEFNPDGQLWNNIRAASKQRAFICKKPDINTPTTRRPVTTEATVPATTTPTTAKPKTCTPGYQMFNATGYCYKVITPTSKLTFSEAEEACQNEQAHLASVHSKEENTFLADLSRQSPETFPAAQYVSILDKHEEVYIGLHYKNGNWWWTDGTPVDYTNWQPKEPNHMTIELAATLVTTKIADFNPDGQLWNNIRAASKQRAFICKKPDVDTPTTRRPATTEATVPPTTTPTTPLPKICPSGYQMFNATGYCYKVISPTSKLTFSKAEEACQNEQAHLASIHSKEENTFLADLSRQSPETFPAAEYVPILNKQEEVLIGLNHHDGKWKWTDGTAVDFTNWGHGEPNRMEFEWASTLVTTKIAELNPDGQFWNNIHPVSKQRAFICKKAL